jgi:hypothetical protein
MAIRAHTSILQYLLAILDMTRPSHPFSPALSSPKPFPSPVIFPSSPFASPDLSERGGATPSIPSSTAATQLALAALDTLLCALVDRPKNMRMFEQIGGLDNIVKILKDKSVAQVVRRVPSFQRFFLRSDFFTRPQNQGHRAPLLLPHARIFRIRIRRLT